jgi:uncharacterized metal-binding protein YceD (DUF177 family)
MKPSEPVPWSAPVRLEDLGRGLERRLVADEAARTRIARVLGLEGLKVLEAEVEVRPGFEGGVVSGRIHAEVVYLCGVSLDPFESAIDADFEARFSTRAPEPTPAGEELGLAHLDTPDFVAEGVIDLGAYVVEHLALEIDPFPRKPGAVFEPPDVEAEPSPFAELAKLKGDARKD